MCFLVARLNTTYRTVATVASSLSVSLSLSLVIFFSMRFSSEVFLELARFFVFEIDPES